MTDEEKNMIEAMRFRLYCFKNPGVYSRAMEHPLSLAQLFPQKESECSIKTVKRSKKNQDMVLAEKPKEDIQEKIVEYLEKDSTMIDPKLYDLGDDNG